MRMTHTESDMVKRQYSMAGDQHGFLCWERDQIISSKHPDSKASLTDDHIVATKAQIEAEIEAGLAKEFSL